MRVSAAVCSSQVHTPKPTPVAAVIIGIALVPEGHAHVCTLRKRHAFVVNPIGKQVFATVPVPISARPLGA